MPTSTQKKERVSYPVLKDIKHALVGLENKETDIRILNYLRFFHQIVPFQSLTFMHVIHKPDVFIPSIDAFQPLIDIDIDENKLKEAQRAIHSETEELFPPGVRVKCLTKAGNPLDEIVKQAKDKQADIVVLGKNVDSNKHMILAKNLVRQIPAHTLMIPSTARPELNTILVPVDFSEHSVKAIKVALAFQERISHPVKIYAVNIYQRPDLLPYKINMTPDEFERNIEKNHNRGFQKFVQEYFPDEKKQILPLLIQSDKPEVGYQIMEQAEDIKADCIIMGCRGHSKIALLLLGSTTETLLHINNSIPTLVVK